MKRPAFQFYPADWRKDAALQSCSVAAQGLWVNILCIAHECEPYGHLTVNGKAMNHAQIGRLVGLSIKECASLLNELEDAGVSSVTEQGEIFSRRMVRDEDLRNKRANGGLSGAEFGILGAEHGSKGGRPKQVRGVINPPLNPPPSSSSSSSSSSSNQIPKGERAKAPPRPDDVAEQVWQDWQQLRKAKRAPVTQTVIDGARSESQKAGMTLESFLIVWCRRGSQGLEAGWLKPEERAGPSETAYQRSKRELYERAIGRNKKPIIEIFDEPLELQNEFASSVD